MVRVRLTFRTATVRYMGRDRECRTVFAPKQKLFFGITPDGYNMDEVDSEALADVAYGIFDHLLTRRLQTQGKYLYALVESGVDFTADLTETVGQFAYEYPQLADALLARFGPVDTIYRMLCEGEGVIPSKTTQM